MTLFLDHDAIERLSSLDLSIQAMETAFRLEGEGRMGPYRRLDLPTERGWLRLLPAVAQGLGVFGFKAMNLARGAGVRYLVCLYSLEDGDLLGVVDAMELTNQRTAATTAVATRRLAQAQIERAAMIGTGHLAQSHLLAMEAVRPVREVAVFSRSPQNRARFIHQMQALVGARLMDCGSLAEALEGSRLVTLATGSDTPILGPEHLRPGMHVNSVGTARRVQFELLPAAFARFDRMVFDAMDLVADEAGDAAAAEAEGWLDRSKAWDLAQVVAGQAAGRARADEITLFKSVGTGLQDLALAVALIQAAREQGEGRELGDFPVPKLPMRS